MNDSRSRWRPVCWPPRPLPQSVFEGAGPWRVSDGGAFVRVDEADSDRGDVKEAFDENYLRLASLDLESDDAIVRFVNAFDVLDVYAPHRDKEMRGNTFVQMPYPILSAYPGFDGMDEFDLVPELRAAGDAARRSVMEPDDLAAFEKGGMVLPSQTVHEFRWAARCMRDLVSAYRCLSEDRPVTDFEWQNPLIHHDVAAQRTGGDAAFWESGGSEIQEFVADTLEIGLAGYSPRVIFRQDLRPTDNDDFAEHFGVSADPWTRCCLELFNHVAEGAIIKDCANETCLRQFVRQVGRAQHGQRRRTGVRFCSSLCARATAQREYQRRRTAVDKR